MMKMSRTKLLSMALSLAVSAAVWIGPAQAQTWEQWIDYGDPGYSETGNSWRTYPYITAVGGSYRYLSHWGDVRPTRVTRVGKAKWQTKPLPYTGIYEVRITYRASENRTPDANYWYVKDMEGNLEERIISQHGDGVKTVTLGQFTYRKDQQPYVLLDGTDDTYSDCADAAHFKLIKVLADPSSAGPAVNSLLLNKPMKRP